MPEQFTGRAARYGAALAAVVVATVVRVLLDPWLGEQFPFATLFFAVMVVAAYGGFGPGVLAVAASAVAGVVVLLPAPATAAVGTDQRTRVFLFVCAGGAMAALGGARRAARLRAESAAADARAQRELLHATLLSIADGVIATDAAGRITFLNAVAESLTGWSAKEATGEPLERVYRTVCDTLQSAQSAKSTSAFAPPTLVSKDGTERLIDERGAPIRGASGAAAGMVLVFRDISERRRQEQILRSFFETTPLMMGVVDVLPDDILHLRDNAAAGRFFGLAPDALRDRLASASGVPPEHLREWIARYRESARAGRPVHFDYAHHAPGGTRWLSATVAHIETAADGRLRCSYVVEDVTERKRIETDLREGEQRLRAVIDNWPAVIFLKDPEGRYLVANRACERFSGEDRDRMRGKTDFDYLPAEVAERFRADDRSVLQSRQPMRYEESVPVDGQTRTFLTVKFPLCDTAGTPYAVCGIATDITHRKLAQDALHESERRWRTLADALPNLVWTDRPDGQCDYLSAQWATYTGVAVEELLGMNWLEHVVHPDDRERTAALWREACADRADYDLEYRIRRHDGVYRWFKTRGVPVRDQKGRIVRWFGTCTDIEDQKQAVEEVRRSEARVRQLADAMPQIVWTARPDGVNDYYNRRWYEFIGVPEGEADENVWKAVIHPDDLEPVTRKWADTLRAGTLFETDVRLLDRKTAAWRWHLVRTVPIRDEAGAVVRWYGTSTDIDAQKRAGEATRFLADASAALADLVDRESAMQKVARLAVPAFADWATVDVLEADGSLRRVAVAHADPSRVELARDLNRRFPPDPGAPHGAWHILRTGRAELVEDISDALLAKTTQDADLLRLTQELGLRSYVGVPLVIRGQAFGVVTFIAAESGRRYGPHELAVAEDLAHRAAIAVENARLYREVQDADQRKDEFLAVLAHELRNPLAPIRNGLQVLKMADPAGPAAEGTRTMMERQLGQMVRLVDDLLDVSRITRGKLDLRRERVELAAVVGNAVETSRPLVEAGGHTLAVELPTEPVYLDADPTRLAQVFANLLNNAAKYTEPGGQIRLSCARDGDAVAVSVADTGVGIQADMLSKVFDMFTQVDRSLERAQGGLGIGLTLVRRLVEMHGGTVTAHSEGPGRGSTFVVRLPLAAPPAAPADRTDGRPARPAATRRILVVDDNIDAAESLSDLLGFLGNDVRTVHDGAAAVTAAEEFDPDVILLDIGLPKLNGFEVCRHVRARTGPARPVIVAQTGWGQEEDRRRSREAGFDFHLVKPVEFAALEKLLAEIAVPTSE